MKQKWLILLCFIFTACTSADKYIPDEIMPVNQMKLVVWEMMQAGELASVQHAKDSALLNKKSIELFQEALQMHHVGKEDFYRSFQFYQNHPVLNQILFDSLHAYAERQRQILYKKLR